MNTRAELQQQLTTTQSTIHILKTRLTLLETTENSLTERLNKQPNRTSQHRIPIPPIHPPFNCSTFERNFHANRSYILSRIHTISQLDTTFRTHSEFEYERIEKIFLDLYSLEEELYHLLTTASRIPLDPSNFN